MEYHFANGFTLYRNVPARQRLGLDSLVVKPVDLKHTKLTFYDTKTGEEVPDPGPEE